MQHELSAGSALPALPATRLFGFESSPVQLCPFLPERLCTGHPWGVDGSLGAPGRLPHCSSQLQRDGRDGRGWWRSAGSERQGGKRKVSGLAGATLPGPARMRSTTITTTTDCKPDRVNTHTQQDTGKEVCFQCLSGKNGASV